MGHLETLLKNANEKRNVDLAYVQTLGQYLAELKLAEDMILAMGPNKDDFVDLVLDMNAAIYAAQNPKPTLSSRLFGSDIPADTPMIAAAFAAQMSIINNTPILRELFVHIANIPADSILGHALQQAMNKVDRKSKSKQATQYGNINQITALPPDNLGRVSTSDRPSLERGDTFYSAPPLDRDRVIDMVHNLEQILESQKNARFRVRYLKGSPQAYFEPEGRNYLAHQDIPKMVFKDFSTIQAIHQAIDSFSKLLLSDSFDDQITLATRHMFYRVAQLIYDNTWIQTRLLELLDSGWHLDQDEFQLLYQFQRTFKLDLLQAQINFQMDKIQRASGTAQQKLALLEQQPFTKMLMEDLEYGILKTPPKGFERLPIYPAIKNFSDYVTVLNKEAAAAQVRARGTLDHAANVSPTNNAASAQYTQIPLPPGSRDQLPAAIPTANVPAQQTAYGQLPTKSNTTVSDRARIVMQLETLIHNFKEKLAKLEQSNNPDDVNTANIYIAKLLEYEKLIEISKQKFNASSESKSTPAATPVATTVQNPPEPKTPVTLAMINDLQWEIDHQQTKQGLKLSETAIVILKTRLDRYKASMEVKINSVALAKPASPTTSMQPPLPARKSTYGYFGDMIQKMYGNHSAERVDTVKPATASTPATTTTSATSATATPVAPQATPAAATSTTSTTASATTTTGATSATATPVAPQATPAAATSSTSSTTTTTASSSTPTPRPKLHRHQPQQFLAADKVAAAEAMKLSGPYTAPHLISNVKSDWNYAGVNRIETFGQADIKRDPDNIFVKKVVLTKDALEVSSNLLDPETQKRMQYHIHSVISFMNSRVLAHPYDKAQWSRPFILKGRHKTDVQMIHHAILMVNAAFGLKIPVTLSANAEAHVQQPLDKKISAAMQDIFNQVGRAKLVPQLQPKASPDDDDYILPSIQF